MQTPWNASYSDGSANSYAFSHTDPGQRAQFVYDPVRPEESSSGAYSGGDPARAALTADDVAQLWEILDALEADTAAHVEARAKGTTAISWSTPEGDARFIVKRGAAEALEAFGLSLRKRAAEQP